MPTLYNIARPLLFRLPAEAAHDLVLATMKRTPPALVRGLLGGPAAMDDRLRTTVFDIDFPNPVGLAAGFDKSGRAFNALGALGFGFVEIGTITALAQHGNPKPRLFRLPDDQALLNRMGFNNPGAAEVAERLGRARIETILGINIGKSKVVPVEEAVEDYLRCVSLLAPSARYLVVNVSSPNTPGLRDLQDAEPLRRLITAIVGAHAVGESDLPVLVKLAPDLTDDQLDQAVDIAADSGAAGLIAVNTTISRTGLSTPDETITGLGAGGISGAPLRSRATEVVRRIHRRTGGKMPIVGVGGIFGTDDAWERIAAGASLIQLYTGFIYRGPGLVREIQKGLMERMEREGVHSMADLVGAGDKL